MFFSVLLVLASAVMVSGCSLGGETSESDFEVAVSIQPYIPLVEGIVQENTEVFSIVPEGYSPELYEPTPQEMKRLASAQLVVLNGDLPYEEKLETVLREANPDVKIIHLNDRLTADELLPLAHHHDSAHPKGGEYDHEHEEVARKKLGQESELHDPHTWLSPTLMMQQVPEIAVALTEIDPDSAQVYADNAVTVVTQLEELSATLHNILDRHEGRAFAVYHPAFTYFAKEFHLEQHYIEVDGREPSAAELKAQIEAIKGQKITTILLEKQFATHTAEAVAEELGVGVTLVDPLSTEYFQSLLFFGKQLDQAF